jgi:3-oxoacyl-[acyl-carrier-protein] synthase II
VKLTAVGLLTGWGEGVAALPRDARQAAAGRDVIPAAAPGLDGERFRRATRECVLGVAAVQATLHQANFRPADIAGEGTALVYVTAAAYGASNRAFIEAASTREGAGALHFPYTAPSAVAAEVAIEFGLTGPYIILIGGGTATVEALGQAERLLTQGAAQRALVLAVETFVECADLYSRARRLAGWPLVEAAACALLHPGAPALSAGPATGASALDDVARRRAGETFACGPLIALALACETGDDPWSLTGHWRGRRAALGKL